MSLRVLIAVTHLLGAGHLTRAAALARAFAQEGHETTLVSGGSPAHLADFDGIGFVQLPPVRIIGTDFKTLLNENGAPVDAARLEQRRDLLRQTLLAARPDVIITELFPFGRRVLADADRRSARFKWAPSHPVLDPRYSRGTHEAGAHGGNA
jgi:predicted glycosyltransferase